MAARVCCVVCAVGLSLASAAAQSPPVDALMQRVGAYIRDFVDRFSNVVAEERYESTRVKAGRLRLRADYLLVRTPGNERNFLTFRDVLEVNGRAVGDREQQLHKLFLQPFESAVQQASAIAAHSAEYIFAACDPLLVMVFLQREYQPRFSFTLGDIDPDLGRDIRRIGFEETASPTVLRQGDDRDLPARGSIWVSERTGRVLRTELHLGSDPTTTMIATTFRRDDSLKIDVPERLVETYYPAPGERVNGVATYSNFRRFAVSTAEQIDAPER